MIEDLLRTLTALPGPTGDEAAVIDWLEQEWQERGQLTRTSVGNLLLNIPGPGPRVLLAAHADELSMIVRSITPEGFLRVLPGERDQFTFPSFLGAPVRILADSGPLPGIFATTTGHALSPEQRERVRYGWDDVFVDTGLTLAEVTERGIRIGTRMVWEAPLKQVGRLLVGKALDDRLGIAVLVVLARRLKRERLRFNVTLAATVQEEIGLLGAASLTRAGREFEIGFIIDNGIAGDIPTVAASHVPVRLGGGPALVHRDSSAHYSPRLLRHLRRAAERAAVPVQEMVLYHYSSDGANLIRQGTETALVAPPIRYSHSFFEAVDPRDVEATVRLFESYLTDPGTPNE